MVDLLALAQKIPYRPGLLSPAFIKKFDEVPKQDKATTARSPSGRAILDNGGHSGQLEYARARADAQNRLIPQAVAHRGYSAKYAENTIQSFEQAIKAGAHALETDMHLTRDGVVALSHDPGLKRCFSVDRRINEVDWAWLKELRTTSADPQPMASLSELLDLLVQSEADEVWLLLDIKMNDDPEALFQAMSNTLQAVTPRPGRPWRDRVMLGYWTSYYFDFCQRFLPEYATTNIGFHIPYSSRFLEVPHSCYVMYQASLITPYGRHFMRKNRAVQKPVIAWFVNDEASIEWCFTHGLDGILITDLAQYKNAHRNFENQSTHRLSWKAMYNILILNIWIWMFGLITSQRARNHRRQIETEAEQNRQ